MSSRCCSGSYPPRSTSSKRPRGEIRGPQTARRRSRSGRSRRGSDPPRRRRGRRRRSARSAAPGRGTPYRCGSATDRAVRTRESLTREPAAASACPFSPDRGQHLWQPAHRRQGERGKYPCPAAVKAVGSAWAEPRCHTNGRNRRIMIAGGREVLTALAVTLSHLEGDVDGEAIFDVVVDDLRHPWVALGARRCPANRRDPQILSS